MYFVEVRIALSTTSFSSTTSIFFFHTFQLLTCCNTKCRIQLCIWLHFKYVTLNKSVLFHLKSHQKLVLRVSKALSQLPRAFICFLVFGTLDETLKTRQCLMTFPNTEKRVENTACCGVFLKNFDVFGNVVKHCLECLIDLLNRNCL